MKRSTFLAIFALSHTPPLQAEQHKAMGDLSGAFDADSRVKKPSFKIEAATDGGEKA